MRNLCLFFTIVALSLCVGKAAILSDVAGTATATQTTSHGSGLYPADKAIDGDLATFNHTESLALGSALELTFAAEQPLLQVIVISRVGCCGGRLNGSTLRLFNAADEMVYEIPVVDNGAGEAFIVDLETAINAKRVRVGFEPGQSGIVHIAEIQTSINVGTPPVIDSFTATPQQGGGTLLEWQTTGADSVELGGIGVVAANGQQLVTPTESRPYLLTVTNECDSVIGSVPVIVGGQELKPRINEFVAYDPGGNDWVELWNPSASTVDLTGYYLTDDPLNLTKFSLDGSSLLAGQFLVFDEPFGLAREAGSYLALVDDQGVIISDYTYPAQGSEASYGLDSNGQPTYFIEATKGGFNTSATTLGFLKGVTFSVQRGFYSSSFELVLTPETEGAEVFYTLNGGDPRMAGSQPYNGASIPVGESVVVRAVERLTGYEDSHVTAHSYLFTSSAVSQSSSPPVDYPSDWQPPGTNGATAPIPAVIDYGMDARVALGGPYTDSQGSLFTTEDALLAIPTMSISLPVTSMWDFDSGIHSNAGNRGRDWEREISFEYIDPATGKNFHTGAGLRIHGGRARVPEALKKSFRVYFRSSYGDSKLREEIFYQNPIEGFDHLILRGGTGKSWMAPYRDEAAHLRTVYLRDEFYRKSHADMGHTTLAGGFVHLYINGLYWGLYNPCERPGAEFGANQRSDEPENFDTIRWAGNSEAVVVDGTSDAWDAVLEVTRRSFFSLSDWQEAKAKIDIDNLIDFMMLNFYMGNQDWVRNNMYAFAARTGTDTRFKFLPWDGEETFGSLGRNSTTDGRDKTTTPLELHDNLRARSLEYRLRFADRVQKHLLREDGQLNTTAATARLEAMEATIDRAIVGESARWGDLNRPSSPFTREGNWLQEMDNLKSNYLTGRPTTTFNHVQQDGLFPSTNPATVAVTAGRRLILSTTSGQSGAIYYTINGGDPREEGGAVSTDASIFEPANAITSLVSSSSTQWRYLDNGSNLGASDDFSAGNWKLIDYDDSSWSQGAAPLGGGTINGVALSTVINIGPSNARFRTAYFRTKFNISDLSGATSANLSVLYDDGVIFYLNGREFWRSANVPNTVVTGTTLTPSLGNEGVYTTLSLPLDFLQVGENVITAEVHQATTTSSDIGFDAILTVAGAAGDGSIVVLGGDSRIKARFRNVNGEWSALEEEDVILSDPGNSLVISKVMYNPSPLTQDEIDEGFTRDEQFEFVEIMNVGNVNVGLTGMRFTKGVDFDMPENFTLQPNQRAVIVADQAAFVYRYGGAANVIGTWESGDILQNDGERLKLVNVDVTAIRDFDFSDQSPWPLEADGAGHSLVLRHPHLLPDHTQGINWRSSRLATGAPGVNDAQTYSGEGSLLDFTFGARAKPLSVRKGVAGSIILESEQNLLAEGVNMVVEVSTDLINWVPLEDLVEAGIIRHGNGQATILMTYTPGNEEPKLFHRYRVEEQN